jgi:divalent metal cation (Fe/Co/Zn/Cd) transporter
VVLGGAFMFESLSITVAIRAVRRAKGDSSLTVYWQKVRDPTLLTVILEDSSALLSIGLAAIGLALSARTRDAVWDAAASVAIGLLLIGVAIVLALENYSLLLGEAAPRELRARIVAAAAADPSVLRVISLRTMYLGPTSLLIVLQADFRDQLSAADVERATERLHAAVAPTAGESGNPRLVVIEPVATPASLRAAA